MLHMFTFYKEQICFFQNSIIICVNYIPPENFFNSIQNHKQGILMWTALSCDFRMDVMASKPSGVIVILS